MAVLTAKGIARVSIPLLVRQLVLPRTVTMVPANGFAGPNGETVTVRVRQTRTAREQSSAGSAITYDDQNENGVDVSLSHYYDAYHLTDEDQSYTLENFAEQITAPQVASVATKAEDNLAATMNGVTADATKLFAKTASSSDTDGVLQYVREKLTKNLVPASGRWLAVAPDILTRLLGVDNFVRADATGDSRSSALRDAVVGRIYGMNVVECAALTDGTAVAYHQTGFAFVTKQPAAPRGATSSAAISNQGIAIRQIFQYDPDHLQDASVLSTFAGSAVVKDGTSIKRAIRIATSTT